MSDLKPVVQRTATTIQSARDSEREILERVVDLLLPAIDRIALELPLVGAHSGADGAEWDYAYAYGTRAIVVIDERTTPTVSPDDETGPFVGRALCLDVRGNWFELGENGAWSMRQNERSWFTRSIDNVTYTHVVMTWGLMRVVRGLLSVFAGAGDEIRVDADLVLASRTCAMRSTSGTDHRGAARVTRA